MTPTLLRDGKISTSYSLPTYRSLETDRGPTFVYNSTSDPAPGLDPAVDQTIRQAIQFDGGTLPTGVYPYSLTATSNDENCVDSKMNFRQKI